jgi:acetylornithine deacetylase/succinyl-diaminopimelate desuccinylase-like protein
MKEYQKEVGKMKEYQKIFDYIDAHFDGHLELTRKFLRQPGVSLTEEHNPDVEKSAELLAEILRDAGAKDAMLFPLKGGPLKGGYPVVYGNIKSKDTKAKTLIVYSLYDLMPTEEPEWIVPPHSATLMSAEENDLPREWGKVVVARGARNQRGPMMGFINAIRSIRELTGDIPVNIIFVFEGEEEIMSPNIHQFVDKYINELKKADGVILSNFGQVGPKGDHHIRLGTKGVVTFELKVKGGDWGGPVKRGLFAADEAWVDAPAWRLVWALSSLQSPEGKILIDGFYDDIRPLIDEEKKLMGEAMANFDEESTKADLGIVKFKGGKTGKNLFEGYQLGPIVNIDGFNAGWTGPYVKTFFPSSAIAKMDIRLVPNQDHEDITRKLRNHLNAHGFKEVEINKLGGYNPARCSVETPLAQAAIRTTEKFGLKTIVLPSSPSVNGTHAALGGPKLGLPVVYAGLGRGNRTHQANEYFTVNGLRLHEKWVAAFLYEYGKA